MSHRHFSENGRVYESGHSYFRDSFVRAQPYHEIVIWDYLRFTRSSQN